MSRSNPRTALPLVTLLVLAGSAAAGDRFSAVEIPTLPGGTGTLAFGVNNAGWAVGQSDDGDGQLVAIVFHDGATEPLPFLPGGSEARGNSINNFNVIAGECKDSNGVDRAVRWEKVGGVWTVVDLGTLSKDDVGFGVATRINDVGQIVGYASADGPYHAFRWEAGNMVDLGTLSYSGPLAYSQGLGISNAGEVTGFAYRVLGGPEHGMLVDLRGGSDITPSDHFGLAQWHNVNDAGILAGYVSGALTGGAFRPAMYDRDTPGVFDLLPLVGPTTDGYAYDISNNGVVVGTNFLLDVNPDDSIFLAFRYRNGVTVDLNAVTTGLPGVLTEAFDVADSGMIVGNAGGPFGPVAVLLVPVCPADFDADGFVTGDDFDAYVAAFELGDAGADFDGDGFVTGDDFDAYVTAFESGC